MNINGIGAAEHLAMYGMRGTEGSMCGLAGLPCRITEYVPSEWNRIVSSHEWPE